MLASCSQDDALQTSVDNYDGSVPVTLSATIDPGVQTRATSDTDDGATRCLLQIIEDDGENTPNKHDVQSMILGADGSYTATAMLNPNHTYTFLFWADGGAECYTADDLTNVTIAGEDGAGIAWYGKAEWSNTTGSTTIKATLTHAVTKVTLQSTTAVPTTTTVTISGVKEYSTFNVKDGKVTGEATTNLFTHSGNGKGEDGDVFSFYALVSDETQTLTLQTEDQPEVPIPNVPLAPNKHIILSGDVAGAGLTEYTFTATIDTDWESSTTEKFPKIDLTTGSQTITDDGEYWIVGQTATNTLTINGNATVHIENTSIKVSTGNAITVTGGNPTIYVEGTNTVESSNGAGIYVAQGSTVTVTSTSRDNVLTARGGNGGSGIGAGSDTSCGNIEIKNVKVYAYSSVDDTGNIHSAGIGGSGVNACGTITIDNATIYAFGASDGAAGNVSTPGIGGGLSGSSKGTYDTITIKNNSQVFVQRGSQRSDYIGSAGATDNPATSQNGIDATIDETSTIIKLN